MATQYANGKIVNSGLVLALDAADRNSYPGSGTTWNDVSGNGNNGTLINGPTFSNNSIVFDGTNDYVNINQTLSTPITIIGFIRYTDQSKTLNTFINSNPHNTLDISLNRTGIGDIHVYIGNGTSWAGILVSSVNMVINKWYQVSFTSTGTSSTLYLNGNSVGTSVHSPSGWGSNYYLGTIIIVSGEYLKGNIGNTFIYNRALSSQEILQNYNAQKSRFGL